MLTLTAGVQDYSTTSDLAASARSFSATARGIMQDAKMHLVSGRGETQLSWVPGVKEQLSSAAKAKTAAVASVVLPHATPKPEARNPKPETLIDPRPRLLV